MNGATREERTKNHRLVLQEYPDTKGSRFLHVLPDSVLRQYTWSWNSTIVYDLIDRAPRSTNRYQWNLIIRTAAPTFIVQFYREHFIARHNDYFAFWNSSSEIYVKITVNYSDADLEPLSHRDAGGPTFVDRLYFYSRLAKRSEQFTKIRGLNDASLMTPSRIRSSDENSYARHARPPVENVFYNVTFAGRNLDVMLRDL